MTHCPEFVSTFCFLYIELVWVRKMVFSQTRHAHHSGDGVRRNVKYQDESACVSISTSTSYCCYILLFAGSKSFECEKWPMSSSFSFEKIKKNLISLFLMSNCSLIIWLHVILGFFIHLDSTICDLFYLLSFYIIENRNLFFVIGI